VETIVQFGHKSLKLELTVNAVEKKPYPLAPKKYGILKKSLTP
jgi:hypothetical protein